MNRFCSNIFIGDLLRALKRLQVSDDATRCDITRLLGLGPPVVPATRPAEPPPFTPPEPPPPPPLPPPASPPAQDSLRSQIEATTREVEVWFPPAPVEPLSQTGAGGATHEPPVDSLFVPNWTRAILSSILSTNGEDGPLDYERIIEALARAEIPVRLPRRPRPTTRRGVQLLVDKSEAMMPFASDQTSIQEAARRAIGSDNVKVLRFVDCPSRGVRASAREKWKDYGPPLPGTPVLLLTDLGIGRPMCSTDRADGQEWLGFASQVRRAGCPLAAFVPYGPRRWPRALRRAMTLVQWDRCTSALTIRNLIGRAHQVFV
ncbi:MAG: hypothetical protein QOE70_6529 [Chthoniobacter sp.]|jgi:hypothetical protein|nr:hypothetical protein [Chthoniobacter sp.]